MIKTITRILMGGCQNYGPFLGTLNIRGRTIIGIQKRDHNFDNHPYELSFRVRGLGFRLRNAVGIHAPMP